MKKDWMHEHAKKKGHTSLVEHALDKSYFFDFKNFSILPHEPNYSKRMIKDSCHISIIGDSGLIPTTSVSCAKIF